MVASSLYTTTLDGKRAIGEKAAEMIACDHTVTPDEFVGHHP